MGCFHEIWSERECVCVSTCVSNPKPPSRGKKKHEYFYEYNPYPPIITPGLPTITSSGGAYESLTRSFGGIAALLSTIKAV